MFLDLLELFLGLKEMKTLLLDYIFSYCHVVHS